MKKSKKGNRIAYSYKKSKYWVLDTTFTYEVLCDVENQPSVLIEVYPHTLEGLMNASAHCNRLHFESKKSRGEL